jgi:hypothetical protein
MVAAELKQGACQMQESSERRDDQADLSTKGDETRRGGATTPIGIGIGLPLCDGDGLE